MGFQCQKRAFTIDKLKIEGMCILYKYKGGEVLQTVTNWYLHLINVDC